MHSLHSTIHLIKQLVPNHTVQTELAMIIFFISTPIEGLYISPQSAHTRPLQNF